MMERAAAQSGSDGIGAPLTGKPLSAKKHFSVYLCGKAVAVIAQVLIVVVVTSTAGATTYLSYTLVLACSILGTNLGLGWSRQALLRDAQYCTGRWHASPNHSELAGIILSTLLATALSAAVVSESGWQLVVTSLFCLTYAMNFHAITSAMYELRAKRAVCVEGARLLATALLPLGLAFVWPEDLTLTTLLLCGAIANAMPGAGGLTRRMVRARNARADLAFGLPMAFWLAVSTVLQFSDRYVLSARVGDDIAAGYATTYDLIARGVGTLMFPLIQALHPLVMAAVNIGDSRRASELLRKGSRLSITFALLLTLGVAVGGHVFLPLISDAALTDPVVLLALGASGAGWQFALLWHKPLEIGGRTRSLLAAISAATVINVALNWAFAGSFGVRFVAINNLAALAIYVFAVGRLRRSCRNGQSKV